jgi:hypothetical protein
MFRDRPDGSMDSGPQLRQWILVLAKFLMAPNVDTFLPGEDDHLAAHLGSGFRRGHGIDAGRRKMKALEGETGRDGTATVVSPARGSVGMGTDLLPLWHAHRHVAPGLHVHGCALHRGS